MFKKAKTETYSVREFLAGKHKTEVLPKKNFAFIPGVDITAQTFLPVGTSPADTLVLLVCGAGAFFIGVTLLEKMLIRNGNTVLAESIASTINFLAPVGIYIYVFYKICKTF
ncbi:hypothetical protein HPJ92_01905 [Anoxybacillus flavithermus]|uniref:hypothetical protein n=1 Tax=Anoxybacillus flavithermus TaxID=33934 RepID=UPI0018679A32|nr:hypothetical protein [Anoxybacillus flavithermus]MBE2931312.1 hypothetical protein [Anoxybacillus flavithermus]